MQVSKLIATCFGIGYIQKGAGTIAALFCCVLWYFIKPAYSSIWLELLILLSLFFIGVLSSQVVEKVWGKDSNRVVIDEVQGMMTALFLVPVSLPYFLTALFLFRFFDIAKPLYIRRMEVFPGGWGVMLDDLLAGIYSCVILQILIQSHLF